MCVCAMYSFFVFSLPVCVLRKSYQCNIRRGSYAIYRRASCTSQKYVFNMTISPALSLSFFFLFYCSFLFTFIFVYCCDRTVPQCLCLQHFLFHLIWQIKPYGTELKYYIMRFFFLFFPMSLFFDFFSISRAFSLYDFSSYNPFSVEKHVINLLQ